MKTQHVRILSHEHNLAYAAAHLDPARKYSFLAHIAAISLIWDT
jgi:hypothetical protein